MSAPTFEVQLTDGAEDDLEALNDYIAANRSPAEANALIDALLETIQTLETWPYRGAVPKELDAMGIREFRQILHTPYRLIYRIDGQSVNISLIADGRRDMQALLERRLLGRG